MRPVLFKNFPIPVAALLMAVPVLLFCVIGCSDTAESPEPTGASAPEAPKATGKRIPKQQFFDYRLIESTAGVRQWVLQSAKMMKYSGEQDVQLVTLHMDFYKNGEHFSVLTSDSGRANLNSNDIHAWGNVIVVTDDGRRLETEELFFNNETELIHNDVFNRFTRDGDVLTGIGLEATPDLEYIEIKEQVEAEVVDEANGESGVR